MKYVKHSVWLLGALALLLLAHYEGFGNGSSYIQFVDGAILVFGAGEYVEKRSRIKRFFENHRILRQRVEHLHEKFDDHIAKDGESNEQNH